MKVKKSPGRYRDVFILYLRNLVLLERRGTDQGSVPSRGRKSYSGGNSVYGRDRKMGLAHG